MDRMDGKVKEQRRHQQKHSGPKAEKKKLKKQAGATERDERKRNPKAFAVQSAVRMAKTFHRSGLMLLLLLHAQRQDDTSPPLAEDTSVSKLLYLYLDILCVYTLSHTHNMRIISDAR